MKPRGPFPVVAFSPSLLEGNPSKETWGTVIAIFRRACYVRGPQGKMMCILDQHQDDGPLNVRVDLTPPCDMPALGIRVGMPLYVKERCLSLAGELLFSLDGATKWVPPAPPSLAPLERVRTRLQELAAELEDRIPDDGLAPLIPHLEDLALGQQVALSAHSQVAQAALPAAEALVEGTTRGDVRRLDSGVGRLVGLGPGLTPSGDDLLAGMMVGLRTTICAGSAARPQSWSEHRPELRPVMVDILAKCVISHALDGTNIISCAVLEHAASGAGSGAIHQLLGLLLQAHAATDILESALEVAKAGHTSGWDSLAGVLLGVHLGLLEMGEATGYCAHLRPQTAYRAAAVW